MANEAFGLHTHIQRNIIRSIVLLVGFPFVLPVVFFCLVFPALIAFGHKDVFAIASTGSIILLVIIVAVTIIWLPIAYFINQWIIDRATGARELSRSEEPKVWNLLENLCISRGIKMPALRIIDTDALNAFASGVREGFYSVTVTRGLIGELNGPEIEAVLAHELTHIRNRDVQLLVVTQVLVGIVPLVHSIILRAYWALIIFILTVYRAVFTILPMPGVKTLVTVTYNLLFLAGKGVAFLIGFVGHFCSLVMNFSLSRRREFMADAGAIELTKNPNAMISALRKISGRSDVATTIEGVREMFFDNGYVSGFESLFATHPPIEKRIEAIIKYGVGKTNNTGLSNRKGLNSQAIKRADPDHKKTLEDEAKIRRPQYDYYPLLSRTISSLEENTPQARRSIYNRARQAQLKYLLTLHPPMSDLDIEYEQRALRDAMLGIEKNISQNQVSENRTTKSSRLSVPGDRIQNVKASKRRLAFPMSFLTLVIVTVVLFFTTQFGRDYIRKPADIKFINSILGMIYPGTRNAIPSNPSVSDVYAFELPKKYPAEMSSFRAIIPVSIKSIDWIYSLSGPTAPLQRLLVGNKFYHGGTVCKPHDCGDNRLSFLIAEDGSHATALLRSQDLTGRQFQAYGQPNSAELAILNYLLSK